MQNYDHNKIEKKWQKEWENKEIYKTENPKISSTNAKTSLGKKMYVLDMFPYPSGVGLHVGHPRGYIGSDVYARMKRMQGYNVLHPMGYDAFGLPAEQYALQHKIHPKKAVEENVKTFRKQLSIIGLSYDWSRVVDTTDPKYYKWTQWIFLQIYNSWYDNNKKKARKIDELVSIFEKSGNEKVNAACSNDTKIFKSKEWKSYSKKEKQDILMKYRLAYEGYSEVNWCKEMGTVLANDEIINDELGNQVSERGGYPVEKKLMRQWFMRITAYADRLLTGLENLEWSDHIKEIQRNWIGRSEGSLIEFKVKSCKVESIEDSLYKLEELDKLSTIEVFTTRIDTIFGATYVVLAPEHYLISKIKPRITNWDEVKEYIEKIKNETDEDRTKNDKIKTGVELKGVMAINPANGEEIPIWIADYVLATYGTGAVMAVPAHDERDFEFAKKYNLPIQQVVMPRNFDFSNPPRPDKKNTKREVVHVILRNTRNNTFLIEFLKGEEWKNQEPKTFIIGGIEEKESEIEAALREIKEETGYMNVNFVQKVPFEIQAEFFANHKDLNRIVHTNTLIFDLIDERQIEISEEEKKLHDSKWILEKDVASTLTIPNDKMTWEFLQKNGFAFIDDGILIHSGKFNGMTSIEARKEITKFVGGKMVTKYKMRDAVFARQRYWGEPIPLIHNKDGTITQLKEKDLPLELPNVKSYSSTGTGESPLAGVKSWNQQGYETNTMPGWAGSSWYFLRYMDPQNSKNFASKKAIDYWRDVDMYVGGAEHATGHLLYARFWNNFLYDMGHVPFKEPFKKMKNIGMVLATDGRKMSKRWNNVINPDDIVKTYGADTLRVYEMFMGPFGQSLPWSTESIIGSRRFIDKIYRIQEKISDEKSSIELEKILHKTIKKVSEDIENFAFNTAISSMMILVNEMEKQIVNKKDFIIFLQILAPFAPHVTEELWSDLMSDSDSGLSKSIHLSVWPKWDKKKVVDEMIKIAIQVNGKVRTEIMVPKDINEVKIKEISLKNDIIINWIENKEIKRFIYVPGRVINIVVCLVNLQR